MSDFVSALESDEHRTVNKVAALDLGSNSFHLVVARIVAHDVQILHQLKLRVRLADGLDAEGRLSAEAIDRGLDNLRIFSESLQDFAPDSVRVVATYTLRKAKNAREFLTRARQILPYPIEIISGAEEARLIYLGVAHTSHHIGKRLVVDIGGGSTELVIGNGFDPLLMRSLQMGCVVYTKRFFPAGEIRQKQFDRAVTTARQELELVERHFLKMTWKTALGSSGTIRTIVGIATEIGQQSSPGEVCLADLHAIARYLVKAKHVDRLALQNLSEERREVFPAGLAILIAVFESLGLQSMEFSPAALREGVIYDMEDRLSHLDVRERTAQSLAARYDVDIEQAQRVLQTTLYLFDETKKAWSISKRELRNLLAWAALLHEVGLQINSRGVQKHSAYILRNVEMLGFNEEQQRLLATLARFQRKRITKSEIAEFSLFDAPAIVQLIALLRLGVLLNIKRQNDILPAMKVRANKAGLRLQFPPDWLAGKPTFSAYLEREKEQIAVLGIDLSFK
ncbi:MAG: exopolyphosphatase [Pseudomonadota bacterium]